MAEFQKEDCLLQAQELLIDHYQNQSEFLKGKDKNLEKITKKFANDEKEHMHLAKNHDTGNDVFHKAFKFGVKTLSRLAIKFSEKI